MPGDNLSTPEHKHTKLQLKKIILGDSGALRDFYNDHVDRLYGFAFYRVGRQPDLAEDVVQDTFIAALDNIETYDPERGSLGHWLCLLSRNIIRTHLTRRRHKEELIAMWDQLDTALADIFESLETTPLTDEILERSETCDLVNMTISNLPEKYQIVLEQKYITGKSVKELAGSLELSEQAVKSLLARARKAFKKTFTTLSRSFFSIEVDPEVR